jgi:hypothetical protein
MYTWTADNYAQLRQVADAIGAEPADLLAVLYSESRLDPRADNGVAKGLNQITWAGASGWMTEAQWRSLPTLSVSKQLPYVQRSFLGSKAVGGMGLSVFANATQLYQANFAPATLSKGSADDTVLYRSAARGGGPQEDAGYRANKGLDQRGTGQIELGDLRRYLIRATDSHDFRRALAASGFGRPNLDSAEDDAVPWGWALVAIGLGIGIARWRQ